MSDYYSLIDRAVSRLDPNAPVESRQALYERARVAQLSQLRSISPPLSDAEITREQLALEEAVRRVEAETSHTGALQVPALDDLVAAAESIGKPLMRAEDRSSVVQAKVLAEPISPTRPVEMPATMFVSGGATGRLTRYWRWRLRSVASNRAMGR